MADISAVPGQVQQFSWTQLIASHGHWATSHPGSVLNFTLWQRWNHLEQELYTHTDTHTDTHAHTYRHVYSSFCITSTWHTVYSKEKSYLRESGRWVEIKHGLIDSYKGLFGMVEYLQCGCYNFSLCIHVFGLSHMTPWPTEWSRNDGMWIWFSGGLMASVTCTLEPSHQLRLSC